MNCVNKRTQFKNPKCTAESQKKKKKKPNYIVFMIIINSQHPTLPERYQ